MVVVEPIVNREKLAEVLNEGTESEPVEFKSSCDLAEVEDVVDLVAEAGAMQILLDGGYVVVGVDGHGVPTGDLSDEQAKLYDQATVHDKLSKYLPEPLLVMSHVHQVDGKNVVMIYIGPSPDCFTVFTADGNYGKGEHRFRKGDVFARHGTKSERWNQSDIQRVRECLKEKERERWERDMLDPILDRLRSGEQAQALARDAPANALDWRLDTSMFTSMVVEQQRTADDIPLRLLIQRLPRDASELLAAEGVSTDDLAVLLDRTICLIATLIAIERNDLAERSIRALFDIYMLGFDEHGMSKSEFGCGISAPYLWLLIIERVEALGALAVRLEKWDLLPTLVLQGSANYGFQGYASWIRHGLTMAARAQLFRETEGDRKVDVSLLALARRITERLECLRPDVAAEDEEVIVSSLCQFDFLGGLATIQAEGSRVLWYPSFARFYSVRVEPIVLRLIDDLPPRQQVFPGTDEELAIALELLSRTAAQEAFRYAGWMGYEDDRIIEFIQKNLPAEQA